MINLEQNCVLVAVCASAANWWLLCESPGDCPADQWLKALFRSGLRLSSKVFKGLSFSLLFHGYFFFHCFLISLLLSTGSSSSGRTEREDTNIMTSVYFNPGSDSGVNGWVVLVERPGSIHELQVCTACLHLVDLHPFLCSFNSCFLSETWPRWRMLKWRLMMERMRLCCRTQCISKFKPTGSTLHAESAKSKSDHRRAFFFVLQQHPQEDHAFCHVLWIPVSSLHCAVPKEMFRMDGRSLSWSCEPSVCVSSSLEYLEWCWSLSTSCWWLWTSPCRPGAERSGTP